MTSVRRPQGIGRMFDVDQLLDREAARGWRRLDGASGAPDRGNAEKKHGCVSHRKLLRIAPKYSAAVAGVRHCRVRPTLVAIVLMLGLLPAKPSASRAQQTSYRDPGGRFVFTYPQSFGDTTVGTDNGFGNRVAAIRFSRFSTQGIGGEAVLGQGPPSLDVQAAGGLYDDIASGTLPAPALKVIAASLPRLTIASFCEQIGHEQHVDVKAPAFASLAENLRVGIDTLDRLGNIAPAVRRCSVDGDTVTFDKEAGAAPGGARRRTYGAVRFLSGRYSMFAIIRANGAFSLELLDQLRETVMSFRSS